MVIEIFKEDGKVTWPTREVGGHGLSGECDLTAIEFRALAANGLFSHETEVSLNNRPIVVVWLAADRTQEKYYMRFMVR